MKDDLRKMQLGMPTGKILLNTLSVIGSIIAIYGFVVIFQGIYLALSLLSLAIVLLLVLCLTSILKIRLAKTIITNLKIDLQKKEDNGRSLAAIVAERNSEIDQLKKILQQEVAQKNLIFHLSYRQVENPPQKEILKEAFRIEDRSESFSEDKTI